MMNLTKIGIRTGVVMMLLLLDIAQCRAAGRPGDSLTFPLFFRLDDDLLLRKYRSNEETLDRIDQLLNRSAAEQVKHICIVGSASPDGNEQRNLELAQLRARAIWGYIRWKHPHVPQDSIRNSFVSDFLPAWICAVERDKSHPRRDKVLEILRTPASLATKWANIQLLAGGAAEYMEKNIFPPMRNAVSCMITLRATNPTERGKAVIIAPVADSTAAPATSELITNVAQSDVDTAEPVANAVAEPQTEEQSFVSSDNISFTSKPLFSLKTNLLFDAASIINVELEVPIGKRWSVAGEWIFPWWLWEQKQHCLQVMSGTLEGRYWLGNREVRRDGKPRQQMTGWFASLYAGGGYYDLEWERKGYQGEFFIAAGIGAGYAHAINKSGSLKMEYSIGVGYMQTNYRKYEARLGTDNEWHLYRRESGKYTWIGPTRAKVSLVWTINHKKRGGVR